MEQIEKVENKIITLRNQQVILDCDVAELYGVQTRDINKAVKNNPDKFPEGYIIQLKKEEKLELVENFHRFKLQKHSSATMKAFTEKGLYMLATILKSPQAVQTTIAIVEAYAKLKELSRIVVEVPEKEEPQQKTLLQRGGQLINEILDDTLPKQSQETSIELNLAMFKLKHSVKREQDDYVKTLEEQLDEMKRSIEELKLKTK